MPKKTVDEFNDSTDYHDLPERMSSGGMVGRQEYGTMKPRKMNEDMPSYAGMSGRQEHGTMVPRRMREEMPGYAAGGFVEPEENYDWEMGHASEYDSSGEPHTEDDVESDHPMEFMAKGGRVKKMARGGMINRSNFAKALRKSY